MEMESPSIIVAKLTLSVNDGTLYEHCVPCDMKFLHSCVRYTVSINWKWLNVEISSLSGYSINFNIASYSTVMMCCPIMYI